MSEPHWAVSLVVSVFPFLFFCGLIVWHGRQMRRCMTTRDGRSLADVFDEIARDARQQAGRTEPGPS
jgi:hypothetical protein